MSSLSVYRVIREIKGTRLWLKFYPEAAPNVKLGNKRRYEEGRGIVRSVIVGQTSHLFPGHVEKTKRRSSSVVFFLLRLSSFFFYYAASTAVQPYSYLGTVQPYGILLIRLYYKL